MARIAVRGFHHKNCFEYFAAHAPQLEGIMQSP